MRTLFFLIFSSVSFAQTTPENQLQQWLNNGDMSQATIGLCVFDLDQNTVVNNLNMDLAMTPASAMKLFSTGAALTQLGTDYQAKTRIYIDGDIDTNGILTGNIVVRGGGDLVWGQGI